MVRTDMASIPRRVPVPNEHPGRDKPRRDWLDWPPTPRVQIVLVAAVCGLINIMLIAIWALVMYTR